MISRCPERSGAILVSALVCLLVALSLVTTMIASTLHRRMQLKQERQARQAVHLLQAGHDRARQQLATFAGYEGETWWPAVSPSEFAEVRIATSQSTENTVRVTVTALYPIDKPRAVRRSRVFTFQTSPEDTQETP